MTEPGAARRLVIARTRQDWLGERALDVLALAVTSWVFWVLNKPFYYHETGYDEEFFTWAGWCITKGLAPYREFVEFKPPVSFLTHALAIALFGLKNYGYRTFFAVFPLASVLALQAVMMVRGIGRLLSLGVILGFVGLFVNTNFHDTALTDCESIGVAYFTLGLAAFLWEGRYEKLTTAAGGFLMCCVVLSKEPFAPIVMVATVGVIALRRGPLRERVRFFTKHTAFGIAAFVVLLCLYMVPTGALSSYIAMVESYHRIYQDPNTSYCVLLGIAHPSDGFLTKWEHIRATLWNQDTLGYLAPLVLPGFVFALDRTPFLPLTMLLVGIAGLWASVPTNCMWVHYSVMSMAAVLYVCVVSADSLRFPLAGASRLVRAGVGAVSVVAMLLYLHPTLELNNRTEYERIPWQEPQPGLLAFIASHTTPSDRIFTTGTPGLYAQADRISALRETNIIDEILGSYPGKTDEEKLRSEMQELVEHMPKVVFIDPEHEWRKSRTLRTLVYPFLQKYHYKMVRPRLYVRP